MPARLAKADRYTLCRVNGMLWTGLSYRPRGVLQAPAKIQVLMRLDARTYKGSDLWSSDFWVTGSEKTATQ